MPTRTIAPFKTGAELNKHAQPFLRSRCDSLQKDVAHCLKKPFAPFPAILYCFSTIDLLGALVGGRADAYRPTTRQSTYYMKRFMNYSDPIPDLLLKIFRHKLVHLSGPKAVLEYTDSQSVGHRVTWTYSHNVPDRHLALESVVGVANIDGGLWILPYDQSFWLDISTFADEIVDSALGQGGYLENLKIDVPLQVSYAAALNDLYDPSR